MEAWPNPFSDKFTVALSASKEQQALILVSDVMGRVVMSKLVDLKKGRQELEVEFPKGAANGLYLLELQMDQQKHTLKVVKE